MKFVTTGSDDVFYNLALEEYIFDHYREGSYLLLWKNDTCIVLGKYQNVYQEINLKEVERAGIKVARRNTGGGTVFHDKGNLNYSLMVDYDPYSFAGYDSFIQPLIGALNKLGIPAAKRNKSDIAIGAKKISGSAQTVKQSRILHHGTLLFDSDLSDLHRVLKPTEGHIESKAVRSVRSDVVNVKDYMDDKEMTIEGLQEYLLNHLFSEGMEEHKLSQKDLLQIQRIREEKYDTWKWNYGKSPRFTFQKTSRFESRDVEVSLTVKNGIVVECELSFGESERATIQERLIKEKIIDARYSYREIQQEISQVVPAFQVEAFTDCFF